MLRKLHDWWIKLWREEYLLNIFYPGQKITSPDGTVTEGSVEKSFPAKKITKHSPKHFVWIDLENRVHELKFIEPVVYHIIKIY